LRHANGRPQAAQIFVGKFDLVYFFRSMLKDLPVFINEEFYTLSVSPQQLDALLASGWRHFGEQFFRYNINFYNGEMRRVLPLRIRPANFEISKSQRRVLKKNQDLRIVFRPIEITPEKEDLFERHKQRFDHAVPDSLYDFLSFEPANVPCEALEVAVYKDKKLLAASFFDVGATAVSAVYAMFDPTEISRSLGIFTMLLTIKHASKNGKTFYYPGYAYEGNSFYDYKKRFSALEEFDWNGNWKKFEK
jgi:leucyl-tRNA---protein transferase